MTEYILRYEELAEFFTQKGFLVVGNDHLGHGASIAKGAAPMYFGAENSWLWVVKDMYTCQKRIKKRYPDIPYIMLGLSLGTFAIRTYLICKPGMVDGVVLAGTGQVPAAQLSLARWVAKREARKSGDAAATPLIQDLSFGTYNKKFAPNRTDFDWLCASENGLDTYINDPMRGKYMTAGLFRELLSGMIFTVNLNNQKRMDKDVPIFLVSGDQDPVGESGKGVRNTCQSFRKAGVKDVSVKLYSGLRHDIFREDERQDIFKDIYQWMESRKLLNL